MIGQIGFGKLGRMVVDELWSQKIAHKIAVLSTSPKQDERICHTCVPSEFLGAWQILYIIVSPKMRTVQGYLDAYYAAAKQAIAKDKQCAICRVVFVSSTSVYTDSMVDIDTIPNPKTASAQVLFDAEKLLYAHFGARLVVVRPSGIYGHTRTRFIQKALQGDINNTMSNRIFDSDLAHFLASLASMDNPKPLYIASDNCPAPSLEVANFIRMHHRLAPIEDRVCVGGKTIIGNMPSLRYPDYKTGYQAILA